MSVLITGGNGLVGRSLTSALVARGVKPLAPARAEVDWTDQSASRAYFERHRPKIVYHLAAKVGGIASNVADPVGFLKENAAIALNVISACHEFGVEKTLVLGSSCMYPRECAQPMREDSLLTGPLEPTNEGYALAKIMALKLAEYYHRQFGQKFVCPIPPNIYGPGDTFDTEKSHVLSALIRRFAEAEPMATVTLWGTGNARREFMHVRDLAEGLIFVMQNFDSPEPINLGTGDDVSIRQLASLIAAEFNFRGRIEWDPTKPDGMPRKCMDVRRLRALGFHAKISLADGIRETIQFYRKEKP